MPSCACELCGPLATFASRNKLFKHLQTVHGVQSKHAAETERVALVFAYLGDGFHGSWLDGSGATSTVEGVLLKALNAENPRGLTRCARTDRGVHALHNVLTIQLPPLLHGTMDETEWLVQINAALPASVSLLRRVTVAPDFDARRLSDRRRYEYLFPYTALTTDPSEAALSVRRRLKRLLKQFVGAHDFARFTKSGEAFLAANDTWRVCFRIHAVDSIGGSGAGEESEKAADAGFVRVSISGRSFLQLQIRKMCGAIIGVMRGGLPATYIHDALRHPRDSPDGVQPCGYDLGTAPCAPAFPLYLAAVSFTPYARRQCAGKGVEVDSSVDDQSPTMMQDPAEATGEAEAAFERRVHAHLVETERRTRAFVAWVAEQDRSQVWLASLLTSHGGSSETRVEVGPALPFLETPRCELGQKR